ncbi:MAG: hypothetical protein AB1295_05720 [Candidatus Micrarchaeota archaeon]
MRRHWAFALLLMIAMAHAQDATEGGDITQGNLSGNMSSYYWAAIAGNFNNSAADLGYPVSAQATPNATIYWNDPNGSYSKYFNVSMIITRLGQKPEDTEMSAPVQSDFNESGMFSNFSIFAGIPYNSIIEDPYDTFVGNWATKTCYVYNLPFVCPYIILAPNIEMAVLKFDNGTHVEPLFIQSILNQTGYNGSFVQFEYIVPVLEQYFFYVYSQKDCNMTIWIDGVQTTVFPKTGVPYEVEVLVTDGVSPVNGIRVDAAEENGRDSFLPLLELGRRIFTLGHGVTGSTGMMTFVLSPTRYNIPDDYAHAMYIEVNGYDGFYCRENLTVSNYGSLSPTYRTSLVNDSYASQVKSSSQNQNALASIASKWIEQGKMNVISVDVYTDGTYGALPTLKAGAPNLLNITVYNHTTLAVINATASILEAEGQIIFVPQQPGKDGYSNARGFTTNQTPSIIPTRYNNLANVSVMIGQEESPFAILYFPIDSTLAPPTGADADMDSATRSAISAAQQNINSILVNIAKSLSTV